MASTWGRLAALMVLPVALGGCIRASDLPAGDWSFYPSELVFDTTVGRTSAKTFRIQNNRNDYLEIRIAEPIPDGDCPEEPFLAPPRSTRVAPGTYQEIRIEHAPQVYPPSGKCDYLLFLWNADDDETSRRTIRLDGGVNDVDSDGDGVGRGEGDCDDLDPNIFPLQQERCNGFDDDCDGFVDDEDANEAEKYLADPASAPVPLVAGQALYQPDTDGDTFPRETGGRYSCFQPPGYVEPPPAGTTANNGGWDCNDALFSVFPGAVEVAGEGIDRNCDGFVTCYLDLDADGDGSDDPTDTVQHPPTDPFCQNLVPGLQGPVSRNDEDCDDANASVNRNALEVCGDAASGTAGVDEDCNGFIDDADPDLTDAAVWFFDGDGDGFGQPTLVDLRCIDNQPAGFVGNPLDCNDGNAGIFPGATEVCNGGIDDDCDGLGDDLDPDLRNVDPSRPDFSTLGLRSWYVDGDGDGYGDLDADVNSPSDYSLSCTIPLGFSPNALDCDDRNATVNPGAAEVAGDQQDQDCDGLERCYVDADNDGYGDLLQVALVPDVTCGGGYAVRAGDCDDNEPAAFPGNTEICDGGIDNDCDNKVDDVDDSVFATDVFYRDADGDSYGDPGFPRIACNVPLGFVVVDPAAGDRFDCNDTSASIYPGAPETRADGVDQSCDGLEACYVDADADGYGNPAAIDLSTDLRCTGQGQSGVAVSDLRTDCDDADPTRNPGVVERCDPNGVDEDCDNLVDDEDNDAVGATLWYPDEDGDGVGANLGALRACDAPINHVAVSGDCNDRNPNINPSAAEICNTVDDDCDSLTDDADNDVDLTNPLAPAPLWYRDLDNDGYGTSSGTPVQRCARPLGFTPTGGDCRDDRPDINPGAVEGVADRVDQNCDGLEACYRDDDDDGWGDRDVVSIDATVSVVCTDAGEADVPGDCNDTSAAIRPDALEICDGVDNDCDRLADDADSDVQPGSGDTVTWLRDADADGYGDPGSVTFACNRPSGHVGKLLDMTNSASGARPTDCADNNTAVNPGAIERPADRLDQNCDGLELCWQDTDDDGFGINTATTATADIDCLDPNRALNATDCDDTNPIINPNGTEVCDPLDADEDCDGLRDDQDGSVIGGDFWFRDIDGDGYGNVDIVLVACAQPTGFVADPRDCNDRDDQINPTAREVCDPGNVDENCDGRADDAQAGLVYTDPVVAARTWFLDRDGDGYGDDSVAGTLRCDGGFDEVGNNQDCDDTNAAVRPAVPELVADGVDQNCDGSERCYADLDGDGFGDEGSIVLSSDITCSAGGVADEPGDCDDSNAAVGDDQSVYFFDADGDSFGDPDVYLLGCRSPGPDWVGNAEDCNDDDLDIRPGAVEQPADGVDQNCNNRESCFVDADGDGFGTPTATADTFTLVCRGTGASLNDDDCADSVAAVYPGAPEVCDGLDDNCNGVADEGLPSVLWYPDVDNDGYGTTAGAVLDCGRPGPGWVAVAGDCDDSASGVRPGGTETCDGTDEDCDGNVDEGLANTAYYLDGDGDGVGGAAVVEFACAQPPGSWSTLSGDCDDTNAFRYPNTSATPGGAPEQCNNLDDDCDGLIDEGAGGTYYRDDDDDGFGDPARPEGTGCTLPNNGTFSYVGTDCDDDRDTTYPGAPEVCDGRDNDCDSSTPVDAGVTNTYYVDDDNDGTGRDPSGTHSSTVSVPVTVQACSRPGGYRATNTDCDDGDPTVEPGAPEICDGKDNDCSPATPIDDGVTTTYYLDDDRDGEGRDATATHSATASGPLTLEACSRPSGYANDALDCDDGNADVLPGAADICDGLVNDCDDTTSYPDELSTTCPGTWTRDAGTGGIYLVVDNRLDYPSAEANCASVGYRPVWVETNAELTFLEGEALTVFGQDRAWWLGLRGTTVCDTGPSSGTWTWYDVRDGACVEPSATASVDDDALLPTSLRDYAQRPVGSGVWAGTFDSAGITLRHICEL